MNREDKLLKDLLEILHGIVVYLEFTTECLGDKNYLCYLKDKLVKFEEDFKTYLNSK